MAKLHAAFWNSEEMANTPELMTPEEMCTIIESFYGGAETAMDYANTQYREWCVGKPFLPRICSRTLIGCFVPLSKGRQSNPPAPPRVRLPAVVACC